MGQAWRWSSSWITVLNCFGTPQSAHAICVEIAARDREDEDMSRVWCEDALVGLPPFCRAVSRLSRLLVRIPIAAYGRLLAIASRITRSSGTESITTSKSSAREIVPSPQRSCITIGRPWRATIVEYLTAFMGRHAGGMGEVSNLPRPLYSWQRAAKAWIYVAGSRGSPRNTLCLCCLDDILY